MYPIFIAALFTITKAWVWKQPKCPLTDEWIKMCMHTHTHTHTHTQWNSIIKKNKIMPFAATWMDLAMIILSEVSQTEKDKCDITYVWNLRNRYI